MAGATRPISGDVGLIGSYDAQIKALEGDPNATGAYKKQLDRWLDQVKAAVDQTGAPPVPLPVTGSTTPVPSQPPAGGSAPPAAEAASSLPGTTVLPSAADAPSSGSVLSGSNVPEALRALAPAIESASQKTGVPVSQLAAVIWAESRGVVAAASTNPGNGLSDSGLMQINPATFGQLQADHPELQGKSLADPAVNILAGASFLSDLHQQFGSWDLAQRAYNSGPLSVDTSDANVTTTGLGDPDYNRKVDSFRDILEAGGSLPA